MPLQYTMRFTLMKMLKSAISMVLAVSLCFTGLALAENVESSLDVGMVSTKTTQLLPLMPLEKDMVSIYNLVYESLMKIDDNRMPQPYLAKEYTVVNGGKTLKFELRENLRFSDGTPLTAYDIAASGNYILENAKNDGLEDKGFYQNMRYLIKEFKAEDPMNLTVTTERAYYAALYSLTFPVVKADMVSTPNAVGSGPYVVQNFTPAQEIWLEVNPNWWQNEPQVTSIMIRFYSNNKDLITDYEYGRIDTAVTRSVAAAQYKSGISSLSISYRTNQLETLVLNHQSYPLGDVNVRKAILKALDLRSLMSRAYMGMGHRAYTPFETGTWMYEDMESSYEYDLEGAKQLLADAGWGDIDDNGTLDIINEKGETKNLVLRLAIYEDPINSVRYEIANSIKEMLAKVKISVNIQLTTMADLKPRLEAGSIDMALVAYQMDVAPDPGFMLISSNVKNGNYSRYRSNQMDELFTAYRRKENPSEFAYAAKDIQRKFAEDIPFIPLFYATGAILTRKMFTTVRDIREFEIFRGIESFSSTN